MKQTSQHIAPYRHCEILDEEFDSDEGFEAAILDSIQRCGTIDMHPNGWGRHDSLGVKTDNMHYLLSRYCPPADHPSRETRGEKDIRLGLERVNAREATRRAIYEAKKAAASKAMSEAQRAQLAQQEEMLELIKKIEAFPHATGSIPFYTAEEFVQFGRQDAKRRGITDDEWIWKRSRFMAGFR